MPSSNANHRSTRRSGTTLAHITMHCAGIPGSFAVGLAVPASGTALTIALTIVAISVTLAFVTELLPLAQVFHVGGVTRA